VEGKRQVKVRRKKRKENGNRKGKQREIIQIIHICAHTVPKSTSESQAH